MAAEGLFQFSVASVVEDVLKQQGKRLNDIDLASRKADEASLRRYEAAEWLRKMVGVVGAKDLPAQPSDEDFRLGLRSGIILCNVLNKIEPGSVPKVVEMPSDSPAIPDGAALSAFQYFENIRNFFVAAEEIGIPTFEASELGQGGKSRRIVNCVLAMKSYYEWKQGGGNGVWKFSGNVKLPSVKSFVRKNSEPFMTISRSSSAGERHLSLTEQLSFSDFGQEDTEMVNSHLNTLVRAILLDKKQEEVPIIVENMLRKVMEEFEKRLVNENGQIKPPAKCEGQDYAEVKPPAKCDGQDYTEPLTLEESRSVETFQIKSPAKCDDQDYMEIKPPAECDDQDYTEINPPAKGDSQDYMEMENETPAKPLQQEYTRYFDAEAEARVTKQKLMVEQQHKAIQELKSTVTATKEDLNTMQMKYHEEFNSLGAHLLTLARAASGYQKVLDENRKLYNMVQDLKGNIRVYCRVRPSKPGRSNSSSTLDHIDDGSITVLTPSKYGKEGRKTFTFNKVFGPSSSQGQVFADTQPLIRSVLDGFNVCIFAYGQTGSGKTHTMMGPDNLTEETLGVNYRALGDLFQISEERKDTFCYEISVQMMEIYNEQVRDLLVPEGQNKRLEIRTSPQNGLSVPDANLVRVTSTSDVISLMTLGLNNRAVQSTAMNQRSSRSHSCVTVHVQGKNLTSNAVLRGTMHLVDLAGSERIDKSEVVGDRLKEAQHINKSLSALGDVISSLAQKNAHVPYRNSKLTQLLQDSLGGQAKTLMFVHISPEPDAIGESISTLKFAERVSSVELGAAKVNKEGSDVKELKEQINNLKAALAKKEGEPAHQSNSRSSSPDRTRSRSSISSGCSPASYSWQQTDVLDNLEVGIHNALKSKRKSLDMQNMLMISPPWPLTDFTGQEKDTVPGDWVDKMIGNKQLDSEGRDTISYDSDDMDATTSDSSEPDFIWQPNGHTLSSIPIGTAGSRLKKTGPKQVKSPEIRSSIPSPSSRRLSNGHIPLVKGGGRLAVHDGKRRPGSGGK